MRIRFLTTPSCGMLSGTDRLCHTQELVNSIPAIESFDDRLIAALSVEIEPVSCDYTNGSSDRSADRSQPGCRLSRNASARAPRTAGSTAHALSAESDSQDGMCVRLKTNQLESRHDQSIFQTTRSGKPSGFRLLRRFPLLRRDGTVDGVTLSNLERRDPSVEIGGDHEFEIRTARLLRRKVCYEERNADQCSSARRKPDRYRRGRLAGRTVCRAK